MINSWFSTYEKTMNLLHRLAIASALLTTAVLAHAVTPSVFFESPLENQTVKSPVKLVFGLTGKKIGPVGNMSPELGHHHIIINGGAIPTGQPVPADAQHIHFGKGQTETSLDLTPGDYHLTLQFANGAHQSYGPEMSKTIRITVAKP